MGRTPKGWWNAAKGRWEVELDGKPVPLAKGKANRAEAMKVLRRVLAERDEAAQAPSILAQDVLTLFTRANELAVASGQKRQVTLDGYTLWLARAQSAFGQVAAVELRPKDVSAWLDAHPEWNCTTRFNAVNAVKAAFRWAKRQGHIDVNPIADLERPTPNRREKAVGGAKVEAVRAASKDQRFRDILLALSHSGCRPGEVFGVTAAMVDAAAGVWRVPNKTRHATKEPTRTVYLTPELLALSVELAAAHPTGPIFRNARGGAWTRNALCWRFKRRRGEFPEPKKRGVRVARVLGAGEVPYSLRHGYVTDALEAGVPIATVAELVGHKDATMIMRVYSHLAERTAHLREAAQKIRPEGPKPDPA